MIKPIKIILSDNKSRFFPVKALWKINNIGYSAVYSGKEEAVNYFTGRYLNINVVDNRKEA